MMLPEWLVQSIDLLLILANLAALVVADRQAQRVKPKVREPQTLPRINIF